MALTLLVDFPGIPAGEILQPDAVTGHGFRGTKHTEFWVSDEYAASNLDKFSNDGGGTSVTVASLTPQTDALVKPWPVNLNGVVQVPQADLDALIALSRQLESTAGGLV